MPLPKAGKDVLAAMQKEYGDKKGKAVFYSSINAGKKGSEKWDPKKKKGKKHSSYSKEVLAKAKG